MTAWSGDPIPENQVRNSTPLQLQGAAVFQNKDCRNCHALEGSGGKRGPDLSAVGTRLTRNQLIAQISNGTPGGAKGGGPGGGNMPAYGKQINPAQMTAPAALWAGGAAVPVTPGPAAAGTQVLGRAPVSLRGAPSVLCAADPPGGGPAALCRDHLAVARAGRLRARPALRRLALSPTR